MLTLARRRCDGCACVVQFVKSPETPLELDSESADVVYCQQGFQFFPDRQSAAAEMFRVLRPGGTAVVSTWCPVDRCVYFGAIHDALCDEHEIADRIAVPFNHMPAAELEAHFASAGFADVAIETHSADMVFTGGAQQALATVFATPIGPQLRAFSDVKKTAFRETLLTTLNELTHDGVTTGRLESIVLTARRTS